jgi:hypothetical protein
MALALTFTGNVDPTALATIVLAIVTVGLAWIGWKALRQTQSEIELSRLEVEQAQRPVLVPVTGTANPRADGDVLVVPIRNIGAGPALDVEIAVTTLNDAGEFSHAAGPSSTDTLTGIGVADPVAFEIRIPNLGGLPSFAARLTYYDVARRRWVTTAKYLARRGGKYVDLDIGSDSSQSG